MNPQSQSRASIETLAVIKNPPLVFAQQANIANGPQQVNSGVAPRSALSTQTPAPAPKPLGQLLEASNYAAQSMTRCAVPQSTNAGLPRE